MKDIYHQPTEHSESAVLALRNKFTSFVHNTFDRIAETLIGLEGEIKQEQRANQRKSDR